MKYLIGIEIPDFYKANVNVIRQSYKYKSSEPHITLISPKALPDEDTFVTKLIDICTSIKPFYVTTKEIGIYNNKLIYQRIESDSLIKIRETIINQLQLDLGTNFEPYYTIIAKNFIQKSKLSKIKELASRYLMAGNKYLINNIVIYSENTKKSIFEPYIKINLE